MDVVIFGANCSPCSAQLVKNLKAREHAEQYSAATDAIGPKHYVVDYFDCPDTQIEAVKLARDVRKVHAKDGFEIRYWVSNSKVALQEHGESKCVAKPLEVDKSSETERVLGMWWDQEEDKIILFGGDMARPSALHSGRCLAKQRELRYDVL